jgi:hypothetical protein
MGGENLDVGPIREGDKPITNQPAILAQCGFSRPDLGVGSTVLRRVKELSER